MTRAPGRAGGRSFPALGAYVGGDIVAGILATGMDRDKRLRLFIDVGTNCEIVLGDGERILATAAPAGPAFEGGAIRCGMRAAEGAIEVVKLGRRRRRSASSATSTPVGLCGSGLVDVVAELVKVGLVDASGRFVPEDGGRDDRPGAGRPADQDRRGARLRPVPPDARRPTPQDTVYLSQRDIRELQFAKAAIATGWSLLLEEFGVEPRDVQQVLLAGSFGSYLSPVVGGPHRAGAQAAGAAHRLGRQRRRRRARRWPC